MLPVQDEQRSLPGSAGALLSGKVPPGHGWQLVMPSRGAYLLLPRHGWQASGLVGVRTSSVQKEISPNVHAVSSARS